MAAEGEAVREKEKERFHWEFLKRSDFYREYCEWRKNPGSPVPDKFLPLSGPVHSINPVFWLYERYGDIHAREFEEWHLDYHKDDVKFGAVDDLSRDDLNSVLYGEIWATTERCKRILGREPESVEKMAKLLCATMRIQSEYMSFLRIKQSDFTIEEADRLADEVKAVLKAKIPDIRLRIEELQRYLDVYDIWKVHRGKGWIPIVIEKIPAYRNYQETIERRYQDSGDVIGGLDRAIKRDLAKAKKHIEEAEKNIFM